MTRHAAAVRASPALAAYASLLSVWALVVPAATVLGGCTSLSERGCEAVCECTGCTDAELADCVAAADEQEAAAEQQGCADLYAAAADCTVDNYQCGDEEAFLAACESELEAYGECVDLFPDPPQEWLDTCLPACEASLVCFDGDPEQCPDVCSVQYTRSAEEGCLAEQAAYDACYAAAADPATDVCAPDECDDEATASFECSSAAD